MRYPNVWGQGALFAFSGLDGENGIGSGLYGWLCGDRPGVSFCEGKLDLVLMLNGVRDLQYEIVASDVIRAKLNGSETLTLLFADNDTVIGYFPEQVTPRIVTDIPRSAVNGCVFYHDTNEDYCALRLPTADGCRFALSVSKESGEEAERKARAALELDIGALAQEKMAFYDELPVPDGLTELQERTLAKCFSIMRSQVYSPQGKFSGWWTTPDRLPHKGLWLWDSVFHSMGNVQISKKLAEDSLFSVLETQSENGFIPHRAGPDDASEITQPPVLAWGFLELYKKCGDVEILEKSYTALQKYLIWNRSYRDGSNNNLYEWQINPDNPRCRCDESGMDNSPRFDNVEHMDCIDFSCFMAREMLAMAEISAVLENGEEAFWREWYEKIREAVNETLWDEKDGLYYDRIIRTGECKRVKAVSSFLPLFAGICTPERAARLVQNLEDPALFGTPFGIPSIARDDATFGTDMWRGPVWINYNYMVALGLYDYGYTELADRILRTTIAVLSQWYEADGVIYEFYDSENKVSPRQLSRKGAPIVPYNPVIRMQSIRDYGWSSTLFVAIAYLLGNR